MFYKDIKALQIEINWMKKAFMEEIPLTNNSPVTTCTARTLKMFGALTPWRYNPSSTSAPYQELRSLQI